MMARIDAGATVLTLGGRDRAAALVPLAYGDGAYLYTSRVFDEQVANQLQRGDAVSADYLALQSRSRSLQLRFNAALLALSLLMVGVAVWIALAVADRLVRPVAQLVDAARRVESGDLTARVPDTRERDEVGTLSNAFNRMTARIQEQNTALVSANDQLDARRALIEAVMAGVSAGVIATGVDRIIRIANTSATTLLGAVNGGEDDGLAGRKLADVAPELDGLLDTPAREAIVQVSGARGETRTLAVRIVRTAAGPILTFDDITQQLLDQRRAAWSDVARRIAHEIKNPLTPIQLAAERLQRRYGGKIDPQDTTFARLTETIVRQVGDLRRMVDEFSSFARMPKPVFRADSLVDVARQSLFLHEVAHPATTFLLDDADAPQTLVMDRRQMGQALTNIVKNAVEAIEAKGEGGGSVIMTLGGEGTRFATVTVADTGVGLPAERDRIIEPYMTTRARGTGLGLAIVKKIVEEHFGTIAFADRPGGGTIVSMTFDTGLLAACDEGEAPAGHADSDRLAELTRNRI
jgi:two-component system nitrogen regulation sensor histidine kinase NtrY